MEIALNVRQLDRIIQALKDTEDGDMPSGALIEALQRHRDKLHG